MYSLWFKSNITLRPRYQHEWTRPFPPCSLHSLPHLLKTGSGRFCRTGLGVTQRGRFQQGQGYLFLIILGYLPFNLQKSTVGQPNKAFHNKHCSGLCCISILLLSWLKDISVLHIGLQIFFRAQNKSLRAPSSLPKLGNQVEEMFDTMTWYNGSLIPPQHWMRPVRNKTLPLYEVYDNSKFQMPWTAKCMDRCA